ncbi:MAG: hypothetical protein RLZZ516_2177 [Cyanobacteriota bacterium]
MLTPGDIPEIFAAALDEVVTKLLTQVLAALAFGHLAEALEFGIKQPKQVVERFLVAAVGRRGEQHQVALWLL